MPCKQEIPNNNSSENTGAKADNFDKEKEVPAQEHKESKKAENDEVLNEQKETD